MPDRGIDATADKIVPLSPDSATRESLSALYLRHRQDVVDFVRRRFGAGPPEPEDVAQAVFLQLAAKADPGLLQNPRSFLLKCAQNLVLDHHRRNARQRGHIDDSAGDSVAAMSDFDTERVVTGKERLKRLVVVLGRLPKQKRQIVLLSRIHGWSCERIGTHLGMSSEAVQKQIERVLRECLVEVDAEKPPRDGGLLARFRRRT